MFLHSLKRKVANDATIIVDKTLFEVPQKYIKQNINVKFNPENIQQVYIYDVRNNLTDTVKPLNKIDNSKVKRVSINYADFGGVNNV